MSMYRSKSKGGSSGSLLAIPAKLPGLHNVMNELSNGIDGMLKVDTAVEGRFGLLLI